jgi:hypothetical protein
MEPVSNKVADCLCFSINEKDINYDFVYQAMQSFVHRTLGNNKKFILICDTLRQDSYKIIDRYSWQTARAKCINLGNKLVELLDNIMEKEGLKIKIFRWDDLIMSESYISFMNDLKTKLKLIANSEKLEPLYEMSKKHLLIRNPLSSKLKERDIQVGVDFFIKESYIFFKFFNMREFVCQKIFYPTSNDDSIETFSFVYKIIESVLNSGFDNILVEGIIIERNNS